MNKSRTHNSLGRQQLLGLDVETVTHTVLDTLCHNLMLPYLQVGGCSPETREEARWGHSGGRQGQLHVLQEEVESATSHTHPIQLLYEAVC